MSECEAAGADAEFVLLTCSECWVCLQSAGECLKMSSSRMSGSFALLLFPSRCVFEAVAERQTHSVTAAVQ